MNQKEWLLTPLIFSVATRRTNISEKKIILLSTFLVKVFLNKPIKIIIAEFACLRNVPFVTKFDF